MNMDTNIKQSFALKSQYHTCYPERCGDALDEALYSTEAYDTWRPLDPGRTSPVFSRFAALPALTKRELRAGGPQGFVPHGRDIAEGLAAAGVDALPGALAVQDHDQRRA